jgi:hypothetical protein
MNIDMMQKKPGRPRAISGDRTEEVISMYKAGLGYRAIAHELMKQGICVDWSTVRRVIKRWLSEKGHQNALYSNSDTILQRGALGE